MTSIGPAGPDRVVLRGGAGLHGRGRPARKIPVVFRGYDVAQVDGLLNRVERALAVGGELQRARARQELRSTDLRRCRWGYARRPVHSLLRQLSRELGSAA